VVFISRQQPAAKRAFLSSNEPKHNPHNLPQQQPRNASGIMGDYQFPMAGKEREALMDRSTNRMVGPPAAAEPSNPPPKASTPIDHAPAVYASQSTAIRDKAKAEGVSMTLLSSIAREKSKVAEERFTSESSDWRKWYAESLVWGYFCKFLTSCDTM
jgi:hypothetical protein